MKINDNYCVRDAEYVLECYPRFGDVTMRAWSSADECLVEAVPSTPKSQKILIVNDVFGALTIPFHDQQTTVLVDSYLSETAIKRNMRLNGIPEDRVAFASSVAELEGKFDVLLMGVNPSRAMLEYELHHVRNALSPKCKIYAAVMAKNVDSSLYTIFQRTLGPTIVMPTSPKTRLFEIELDLETRTANFDIRYSCYKSVVADVEIEVASGPGVFSADHLDTGARLLLEQLPRQMDAEAPIAVGDLGCGAGALGLVALSLNPNATAIMVDESRMALVSAKETFSRNGVDLSRARFRLANGWDGTKADSLDLVLCNMPGDIDASHSPRLALQFLRQTLKVLKPGGRFLFAAREDLPIMKQVRELFPAPVVLVRDEGNIVVLATKPAR